MQNLPSFSDPTLPLLEADLQLKGEDVYLEFQILDKTGLFELPLTAGTWQESQVPRQEGLWKTTCFEAFLKPVGSSSYFEFNFSLSPAWDAYHFDNYRQPQPNRTTEAFILKSMAWDPLKARLLVELQNKTPHTQFQIGLTAVLQEKSGVKHYCALVHKGTQPDFHLSESFILKRGSEL